MKQRYKSNIYALFLLCSSCLTPILLFGQNDKINNTTQLWSEIDLLGRLNNKIKWQCDFQYSRQSPYENLNFIKNSEQLTIRPWLHYYFKPTIRISAFAGLWYNFFIGENVNQRQYPEFRPALQIQFYKIVERNTLSARFRTELREIEDKQENFEPCFRERIMFKFQRLLIHKSYDKNSVYLIAQNELFFNDGSPVTGYKFFDQNRVFFGLGYNLTNNISLECGYFNQFAFHAHNTNFDSNHILQVSLILDNLTTHKLAD